MKHWGVLALILWMSIGFISSAQTEGGGYVAYVAQGPVNTDIFVADLTSGLVRNLTNNQVTSVHPSWSGDGSQIVFNNVLDGNNPEIFVMEANGLQQRNVSNNPAFDVSPDWSPVSNEIAFMSNRDGGFDLYVLDLDTDETRRLTTDGTDKNRPDWSPDGTQIAYWQLDGSGNASLMIIEVATGDVTTLVAEGQNLWPAWSPDGTQITVHSEETGSAQIYVVDVDSGARRQITTGSANNFRADWSPDSSQIVFMSNRNGDNDLFIMNADGTDIRPLIVADGDDISPTWRTAEPAIDFDTNPNLGLSAVQVTGDSIDENEQLGAGIYRVFAPPEANVEDYVRVRLEIELVDVESVPEVDDVPLREEGDVTVYRYMGAEITGIDIDDFEIFPEPSGYLLQIQEDDTNYWEWYLRPLGSESIGSKLLFVEIYLPDVEDDEVVTKELIKRIPLSIEIVSGEPDEATSVTEEADEDVSVTFDPSYRQAAVNPEDATEGITVYLNSENLLAIRFADEVDVSDMSVASEIADYTIAQIFPDVTLYNNVIPADFCLFYERDGTSDMPPLACQTENRMQRLLNPGDIFWYSSLARSLQDIVIRKDDKTFVCSPMFERCDF